jgi:hypothetical protein
MQIDQIYIIALNATDPTVHDKIFERLEGLGLDTGIPYEIIDALNLRVSDMPEGLTAYSGWNLGPGEQNEWWNRDMLVGEIGCAVSHFWAWNRVAQMPAGTKALILEEDFWGQKPLKDLTEYSGNWDIAFLGRWTFNDNEEVIEDPWVKMDHFYNAHAYVLTQAGANKMLENKNIAANLIPADEFLPAMVMEHRREDIRTMYPPVLDGIGLKEDWVVQNRYGQLSTIEQEQQEINSKKEMEYYEILDTSDWDAWKAKYLNHTMAKGEYDLMVDDLGNNIYEFQLFTEKFCREAIALAESKDKWTIDRHEFYPTNDVLLNEIGLDEIYNRVIAEVISPLCVHLWTLEGDGWAPLKSENFMARYTTDRQSHLALHHDYSHVTMVVKLNDAFEGGGTWFPKYKTLSNPARIGTATLHPGFLTHLHGARPIYSGKRYICVSFMQNSKGINM